MSKITQLFISRVVFQATEPGLLHSPRLLMGTGVLDDEDSGMALRSLP